MDVLQVNEDKNIPAKNLMIIPQVCENIKQAIDIDISDMVEKEAAQTNLISKWTTQQDLDQITDKGIKFICHFFQKV